jgi:hypothetical protein
MVSSYTLNGQSLPDRYEMRQALARDGAFICRNVLTSAEVSRLREAIRDRLDRSGERLSLGKTQPNAAAVAPELAFIFSHPKIISIFKHLYDEDEVVFTSHCDIHMNMLSGWHKDSGEAVGGYFRGDYFDTDECCVHKVGIYLQDATARDGLTIKPGSHRVPGLMFGEPVTLVTHVGDIVIFDVRLTHTGQLPDRFERVLKGMNRLMNGGDRNRQDFAFTTWLKDRYWQLIGRRDRLSIFFTYGRPNSFTYDFSYFNVARQHKQTRAGMTGLPGVLASRLQAAGVTPFDPLTYDGAARRVNPGV